MKLKEIRELSVADIDKKVVELQRELGIERGNAASGSKTAGKIRGLRRTIAKMLCIKRERELNINQPKKAETGEAKPAKAPKAVTNEKISMEKTTKEVNKP